MLCKAMLLSLLSCRETLELLDDYLDRELAASEVKLVQRHLKICRECSRKFAFEEALQHDIRDKLRRIDLPADLLDKISSSLRDVESSGKSGGGEGEDNGV